MTDTTATPNSILFVGGGLGTQSALKALRDGGYTGKLTVVDPEGEPYDRPPLSKDYLLGTKDVAGLALAPANWYADNQVAIVTGTATALTTGDIDHPATVTLADGDVLSADAVVIATGGRARPLPIPGGENAMVLRTKGDADALREALKAKTGGANLVVIGAGLIGAETAAAAQELGARVALVEPLDPPLVPAVGEEIARILHDMHTEKGIEVHTGLTSAIEVNSLDEIDDGEHTPFTVVLADGTRLPADVVLAGIGIIPNVEIAAEAGLEIDNGIVVDERQRTSAPRIYAIGDVSRTRGDDSEMRPRAEHWEAASNTGLNVAAALLGQDKPKHSASWFWSDRHGVHVEGVGSMTAPGTTVLRVIDDKLGGKPAIAFRLDEENTVIGCAAIDGGIAVRAARRMIDNGKQVDPAQLADPTVDLRKLAR